VPATADGALSQFPKGHEIVVGFHAAAAQAGEGAMTPLAVLVKPGAGGVADEANAAVLADLRPTIARDPAVVRVTARSRCACARSYPRRGPAPRWSSAALLPALSTSTTTSAARCGRSSSR
jgi:hypothetical protein